MSYITTEETHQLDQHGIWRQWIEFGTRLNVKKSGSVLVSENSCTREKWLESSHVFVENLDRGMSPSTVDSILPGRMPSVVHILCISPFNSCFQSGAIDVYD